MSTHEAKVVRIKEINTHPNADSLEITTIYSYPCCIRKDQFKVGDLAVFIEPDTLVPVEKECFSFLAPKAKDGYARISAMKLRGYSSFGLLIKADPNFVEDQNVFKELGLKHWEPEIKCSIQDAQASAPNVYHVKYDMESYRKYSNVIQIGEEVEISEKLHGASARFVFTNGVFHVGSHNTWKKFNENNLWWSAALNINLEEKVKQYPDHVFYGEAYGNVQNLRYGHTKNQKPSLAFFDIMHNGQFLSPKQTQQICKELDLPHVPILFEGPWEPNLMALADGKTTISGADHIREGCVIKPLVPRIDPEVGRIILKIVSADYLAMK
jgi:RNA ligase (TIGR02306 family)